MRQIYHEIYCRVFLIGGKYLLIVLSCILISSVSAAGDANTKQSKVLRFGLLPYLSPSKLVKTWEPMIVYLQEELDKKIVLKSAPNFESHLHRIANNDYDIVLTAPHFAILAVSKFDFQLLAGFNRQLRGDLFVSKKISFESTQDLSGKVFATPDRLAIITLLGEMWLKDHGIEPHRSIKIKYTPSHNNALMSVAEGISDAGVAVGGLMQQMPPRINSKLKKIGYTREVPHVMFIANSSMTQREYTLIKSALVNISLTSSGKAALAAIDWGDLELVSKDSVEKIKPIVQLLESRMNNGR